METFGNGLRYLRIPGSEQRFEPRQVNYYPPQPQHRGSAPIDNLIRSGYYEVSQGGAGVHTVPATLVYFSSKR